MSEEQLKAAVEPTEQVEEGVEEISEEDLAGVAGGGAPPKNQKQLTLTKNPLFPTQQP